MVVLVIAIGAAAVAPMLGDTDVGRLKAAGRSLLADLDYARVESISHTDDTRVVVLDGDGGGYHLAAASATGTPLAHPVGDGEYDVRYGQAGASYLSGVSVAGTAVGGDDQLGFGIYGQLDQTGDATITLSSGEYSLVITVDASMGEASTGAVVGP